MEENVENQEEYVPQSHFVPGPSYTEYNKEPTPKSKLKWQIIAIVLLISFLIEIPIAFFLIQTHYKQIFKYLGTFGGLSTSQQGDKGFQTLKEKQALPVNWIGFKSTYGFALMYPKDWNVQKVSTSTASLVPNSQTFNFANDMLQKITFTQSHANAIPGIFQALIIKNSQKLSLEQWVKSLIVPLNSDASTNLMNIVGDEKLGNLPAVKVSINALDYEELGLVAIKNNFIYLILFPGNNPEDTQSEAHDKIYENMLLSFSFTQ